MIDQDNDSAILTNEEAIRYLKESVHMARILKAVIEMQPKGNVMAPESIPYVESGSYGYINARLGTIASLLGLQ